MGKRKVTCPQCGGNFSRFGGMYCGKCAGNGFVYEITCQGYLYSLGNGYKKCEKCGTEFGSLYSSQYCDHTWLETPSRWEEPKKKWDYCAKPGCDCDLPKVCTNSDCHCGRPKICIKQNCDCSWRKGCTNLNCHCGRPKVYI